MLGSSKKTVLNHKKRTIWFSFFDDILRQASFLNKADVLY